MPGKLTQSESALVLRELYCDRYTAGLTPEEHIVGADVAYRYGEDDLITTTIRAAVEDYIALDIKSLLGTPFEKYFDFPSIVKDAIKPVLEELPAKRKAAMDQLKEGLDGKG